MGFSEKFQNVMSNIDKTFDDATKKAKEKLDEHLTEEKKAEYKDKATKAFNDAENGLNKLGDSIESGFKSIFGNKN